MKISLNWLSNFISLTEKDHEKIKEVITARTAEIETMDSTGEHLENVVLGKIEKIWAHPNADKLKLTLVNDGKESIQVVCGGSNLKEGMKVAFAKLGAVVKWHGTDVVKMEKVKIRGEESLGMICASEEIGLEEMFPKKEEKEIVDLSHLDAKVGIPLAEVLGLDDTVIDIDNHAITNRPDLFSHRGFAREFAANQLGTWKKSESSKDLLNTGSEKAPIEIEIKDKDVCSNYYGVHLSGIKIDESPDWMKSHLTACGIRPISNIVDITNYVMLELGMPMHAFDLHQIKGKKWTMRKAKKGEKVITLDEKEIELIDDVIVFDDGHELFDLCGVMGGLHSGIKDETKDIWLHAPVYNPGMIRKAVRRLNQNSDAATIYEKGVDNELAQDGMERAIELILELCPTAKVESKPTHIRNIEAKELKVKLTKAKLKTLVGIEIEAKTVEKILGDLGFELKSGSEGWEVSVPSWRQTDVKMEADVIEEVARVYAYDNIPMIAPEMSIAPVAVNPRRRYERELKEKFVGLGFNEMYSFAFLGPKLLEKAGQKEGSKSIVVENPISSDLSIMRESLLPWTLETIANNLRYKRDFRLFEVSRTYHKTNEGVQEKSELILASVGEDFRELQGVVQSMKLIIKPGKAEGKAKHPGRTASLMLRGKAVGTIYELHPQIAKNFDIKTEVTIAEIDLEMIHEMEIDHQPKYKEIPRYPAIELDVSILIPKKELAENYFSAIQKTDKTLIKNIQLIDEYTGQNIEESKRALTYSIQYRSDKETLTDEQVGEIHKKVIVNLKEKGAVIRD